MGRPKKDFKGLLVQDFLTFNQALAYAQCTAEQFKEWYLPYCKVSRCQYKNGLYFVPELRQLIRDNVQMLPER